MGQLTPATGDDFTVAVYNDIHTDNGPQQWTDAVDWLVGANGRGPGGMAAVSYWNIKAIAGVGDYVTNCNDSNWKAFLAGWRRISAFGLPGIWPPGNHDQCAPYTASFGSSLQSARVDVSTTLGAVHLGLLGVGVADDMHDVHVTGNLGASGSTPGWITLLKFRPSHRDIQVAVYLSQDGAAGSIYARPYTWLRIR